VSACSACKNYDFFRNQCGNEACNEEPKVERDCNTCKSHIQGVNPFTLRPCSSCIDLPLTLPNWSPMSKAYDATFRDEPLAAPKETPLDTQVGGNHYKGMKIQPLEFALVNRLDAAQSKVVKYVCRVKGDLAKRLEDLDKAIHVIQVYKQLLADGKIPSESML